MNPPIDVWQRTGAVLGLAAGLGCMYLIGRVGLIEAFIAGAGGCVAGSMIGSRFGRGSSS